MTDASLVPDFEVSRGRIIVLGDTRPRDYLEFFLEDSGHIPRLVFDAVALERAVAVVHCGDLAVYGSRQSFWQGWTAFDRDAQALLSSGTPIFPAIGNHEYRGFSRESLRHYFARFPHLNQRRWYTLRSGETVFVLLDSNFKRLGAVKAAQQEEWLRSILQAALADKGTLLVLPVVHHPPFTNIDRRYLVFESRAVQRRWLSLFLEHPKVAGVFSGHVHTYEHFVVDETHFIVTGGAGSPRFRLRAKARRRRTDAFESTGPLRPFHYLRLLPEGTGEMRVETVGMLDSAWRIIDTFTLLAGVKGRIQALAPEPLP